MTQMQTLRMHTQTGRDKHVITQVISHLQRQLFRQSQFAGQVLFGIQAAVAFNQPTSTLAIVHHHAGADFGLWVLLAVHRDGGADGFDAAVAKIDFLGAGMRCQIHVLQIQLGRGWRVLGLDGNAQTIAVLLPCQHFKAPLLQGLWGQLGQRCGGGIYRPLA